jgi:hypothetical protein
MTGVLQGFGGRGLRLQERQQQVLRRDVLVLEGLGLAHCLLQDGVELGRDVGGRALGPGKRRELLIHFGGNATTVRAQLAERGRHHSPLLREQGLEKVLGRHLGVIAPLRIRLGGRQRLLGLHRELIHSHSSSHLLAHKIRS